MIERLYRILLWFSPGDFRRQFGEEVLATARSVDERGLTVRGRLLAIGDVFQTVLALHADRRAERLEHHSQPSRRMEGLRGDIILGLRTFHREPLFATFVVATLALSTGANAALFGIADRLLFRGPDHIKDADRVVRLYVTTDPPGMRTFTSSIVGHVTYQIAQHSTPSAEAVAAYTINEGTSGRGAEARRAVVGSASAGFFPLLGVQPLSGRFFSEREDAVAGAERVAVISARVRERDFGGADVLGRPVIVNDETFTIIGVAREGFTGAELGPVDYWVPINLLGPRITSDWANSWSAQWLNVVLRMKPGATAEQLANELTSAVRNAYTGDEVHMKTARVWVGDLPRDHLGDEPAERRVVRWLFMIAVMVLLIACANITNLFLARGERRMRDVGIRLALGASRWRIIRMLLVESILIAAVGCALGLIVASLVGGAARTSLLSGIEWTTSPVGMRVLLVSSAAALVIGVAVGLLPAAVVARDAISRSLRTGIRDGGSRRMRLRSVLTVAQTTMSVALLIGAGLFVRSTWNAAHLDLGIEADRVLAVEVSRLALQTIPEGPARDAERTRRRMFFLGVIDRMKSLPGVEHAAVAVGMPFGNRFGVRVRVPGMSALPKVSTGGPGISAVSADYFATIGTSIRRGRPFAPGDRAGSAPVAIINEFMARTVWPGIDPLGRCVMIGEDPAPCATIVGIAENTHRAALIEAPKMHIYIPHGQEVGFGGAALLVRGREAPETYAQAVRRELTAVDPTITFVDTEPLQARIDPKMQSWRLGMATLGFSGLLALFVAAAGIYSVLSYVVADRRHELGVRIALGARVDHVTGLIVRWSLGMAGIGIVAGWSLAATAAGFIQPLLFRVSARDPVVFGSVAALLFIVAAAASAIPALRAARVDPLEALRTE